MALAAPRSLLPKANSALSHAHDASFKPAVWAQRTLGLNASVAMAKHLQYVFTLLDGKSQAAPTQPLHIRAHPHSPTATAAPVLDPLPLSLHVST